MSRGAQIESHRLVLVVEDDIELRNAAAEILEQEGYQVRLAANGQDAFDQLLSGSRPSVMLLDLMMPIVNGWELLTMLSSRPDVAPDLPVVIMTAARNAPPSHPMVAAALSKPFSVEELLATLERVARS